MTIPNTKESQRVLAEEIAKQVADNSGWKSITSNYARIYQAAFLGVVKTCERLAAASQSNAEFQIDYTPESRHPFHDEPCRHTPEDRYAAASYQNMMQDDDVLVEIDEGRP